MGVWDGTIISYAMIIVIGAQFFTDTAMIIAGHNTVVSLFYISSPFLYEEIATSLFPIEFF